MLFEDGHLASHEGVKHWRGRSQFAVPLAPHHAFIDERLADCRHGGGLTAQGGGDPNPIPDSAVSRTSTSDSR
jgi:hypothetical protein